MPRRLQDRHDLGRNPGPPGPPARLRLPRRTQARQPLPHDPRLRRLRRPRQVGGHRHPRPGDRPDRHRLPKPPPGPLRPPSTCTSSAPSAAPSPPRPSAAPTKSKASSPPGTPPSPARPRASSSPSTKGRTAPPARAATRPFSPGFQAASAANTAAAHTAFSLDLTRNDGEQNLSALNVTTPPGFSATLKGVPYCPEAAIDSRRSRKPHRPRTSRQARAARLRARSANSIAGAGAGTHPLYLPGKVYLAGPYKGAPLSLRDHHPGGLRAAMTSATSSSAPRSTSTPKPPRSPPVSDLAPDLRGHPPAPAPDPGQPQPPRLRPQPDRLQPALGQPPRSSATKAPSPPPASTSRSPTAPPCASPPSSPWASPARPSRPATPPSTPISPTPAPAYANISRAVGHPAAHRARRQRPHQRLPAPGSSSPKARSQAKSARPAR